MIQVCLYVDDILLTWSCISKMNKFMKVLMHEFEITNLRNMVYFIGMEIFHFEKGIIMNQLNYEIESHLLRQIISWILMMVVRA